MEISGRGTSTPINLMIILYIVKLFEGVR